MNDKTVEKIETLADNLRGMAYEWRFAVDKDIYEEQINDTFCELECLIGKDDDGGAGTAADTCPALPPLPKLPLKIDGDFGTIENESINESVNELIDWAEAVNRRLEIDKNN